MLKPLRTSKADDNRISVGFLVPSVIKGKGKGTETYSSLQAKPAITQSYLSPGRGDIPAFTPAEAGTRFSVPGGIQG